MESSKYEGRQGEIPGWTNPQPLEIFHNVYEGSEFRVIHSAEEFNSVCPKTGLPDFGTIVVEYVPDTLCLELKSLKLYLNEFRHLGVFMENSVNKIFEDILKIIPDVKYLAVSGTFNPRGGIQTSVVRIHRADGYLG